MGDYDVKVFVGIENEEKLRKKGLTQIEKFGPWDNAREWYIGVEEWYESFLEEGKTEDEADVETEMLASKRDVFTKLIREVFPDGAVYLYANKRNPSDELTKVFKGRVLSGVKDGEIVFQWIGHAFWEALENMEKWMDELNIEYLQFGNDDLNGWALTRWKISEERTNLPRIKKLIKEAEDVGEV